MFTHPPHLTQHTPRKRHTNSQVLPNSDDFNRPFTDVSFVIQSREPDAVIMKLNQEASEISIKNRIGECYMHSLNISDLSGSAV